jgi:hypothetical protein
MQQDIAQIKTAITRLRADLMASNLAIAALTSVLTAEQRHQALQAMIELSVMQEQTAETAQKPDLIELLQPAVQRMYSNLQAAHKMRLHKDGQAPTEP